LPDQESVRLALAATLRKGDRLVARVASEALAYLGGVSAGPLLIGIAMDESLSTSQRASAVWAMEHHLPALREQLAPHEQIACMSLPMFEMLEDPEADQGFGLRALIGSYGELPPPVRLTFLSAIAHAARERGHKLAGLCMHLLGAEEDGERRRKLLDLAASEATPAAADLLATFAAKSGNAQEAKYARRHLHLLRAKGLRGVVRPEMQDARAMVTGVDGDACFAVNIIIPRVPTFDFANVLFHLDTGVRDGFVMHNLPARAVDELVEKIKQGCGTLAFFVPMPLVARIVDEVLSLSKLATLQSPDVARALALAEAALVEARRQPYVEPEPPLSADVTAEEVGGLLDSEGFESWFFESGEDTVKESLARLSKPIRAKGKAAAQTATRRLTQAAEELCSRLRADNEHLRLQRMLRHQARLFGCAGGSDKADLCRRLAVEVLRPGSRFLASMALRALVDAMEDRPDETRPVRFLEAREHLRGRLGREQHQHRKSDVAHLDMAAAAHTEMVIFNRKAPSDRRASLSAIEDVALVVGEFFARSALAGGSIPAVLDEVAQLLDRRDLFPAKERIRVAAEIVSGMVGFRDTMCEQRCPHHCFEDPKGDGRAAFYAEGAPWSGPEAPARGSRNKA
jgi:hypothetical protein